MYSFWLETDAPVCLAPLLPPDGGGVPHCAEPGRGPCIYIYIYIYIYICIDICIYIYIYTYMYRERDMFKFMFMCVYMLLYICI